MTNNSAAVVSPRCMVCEPVGDAGADQAVAPTMATWRSLLLRRLACFEARCRLQRLFLRIDDDAAAGVALLQLQRGQGDGDVLVADAEKTADIDDHRGHPPIRPDEHVLDRAELLTGAIVDVAVDVFVGGGAD